MKKIIEINTSIDLELIDSLIVTALEGGSNYWYFIPKTNIEAPKNFKRDDSILYDFLDKVYQGASLPIHDAENEQLLGNLTMERIKSGLSLLSKDYSSQFSDLLNESWDAETADTFFQLAIMGKVIFG